MVNTERFQSGEAPSSRCCSAICPPLCPFQAHTRSRNASRPSSWRLVPPRASCRSTTVWVAMPAWSIPGCQRVLKPRMRCQRVRVSSKAARIAWPMWRLPVTLGGGIWMT